MVGTFVSTIILSLHPVGAAVLLLFSSAYKLSTYWQAARPATAPSPTAVVSWRTDLMRPSPATNTPGKLLRQRAVRRKLTGVLFLVLGLFLAIPGMRKPEELILPLVVGVFAAVTGIIRLLPRRKKEDRRLRRSAQTLLQNRAAVTEASVVFTEDGMRLDEGEPIGFERFATAVETEDLYFFTWNNQELVLFKQEL